VKQSTQKAHIFLQVLPYIQKFHGKIVVIKCGGQIVDNVKLKRALLKEIVLLKYCGLYPVVLHGGGPSITKEMSRKKIKVEFVNGLRVTDLETIRIIQSIFRKMNGQIVNTINKLGVNAKELFGDRDKIFRVIYKDAKLGLVGSVKKVQTQKILLSIKRGFIPVISPLGIGQNGKSYNINADTAAASLAIALKAEKLILVSDVDGVYNGKKFLDHLSIAEARELMKEGTISRGMIPKVEACISAVSNGVHKAQLINGLLTHALFLEIFTNKGIGTEIVKK
jgi:acetylglutamate kinase